MAKKRGSDVHLKWQSKSNMIYQMKNSHPIGSTDEGIGFPSTIKRGSMFDVFQKVLCLFWVVHFLHCFVSFRKKEHFQSLMFLRMRIFHPKQTAVVTFSVVH